MTNFTDFLTNFKSIDPALIECVSTGYSMIFESDTNQPATPAPKPPTISWEVTDSSLGTDGGDITVYGDDSFTRQVLEGNQQFIEPLLSLYNSKVESPIDMAQFIESLSFGAKMTYTGEMMADGDMRDWYNFEVETSEGIAFASFDGDDFAAFDDNDATFGALAKDIIEYVDESSAVQDAIDKISEGTYKSNPSNRWAYGATY